MSLQTSNAAIARIRELHDRAAGEAFLPDGWQALAKTIEPLLDRL